MATLDDPNYPDAPPDTQTPSGPSFDTVNAAYQKWLGRPLSQQEYDSYWANATNFDEGMVANSQEALARANQNVPNTPTTDQNVPIAPGNQTGQFQPPSAGGDYVPPPEPPPGQGPQVGPPPPTTQNVPPPVDRIEPAPTGGTPPPAAPGTSVGAPTPNLPTYTPPPAFSYQDFKAPDPFSYADFVAPDPNELANDPWTKYTLKTEQDAISRSAAARGVLNTGGTINDLLQNAADVNTQGYQNIYNNKMAAYQANRGNAYQNYALNYNDLANQYATNRGNALENYNLNYNTQYVDPYKFQTQAAEDTYDANAHNFDMSQYYNQHNLDQNLSYAQHNTDLNKQYDWYQTLFNYQQGQDEWDRKFKLLGLV